MKRRKTKLKYKKERAVLSDVLPYELPLTFSNRSFCEFLRENRVEYRDEKIFWKQGDGALDDIVRLLFGAEPSASILTNPKATLGKTLNENCVTLKDGFDSIPFGYKILHKENEFRELTICHPRNQIQLVDIYDKYKELILYYCTISPFSIRRPVRVSKCVFHKDKVHSASSSIEIEGVEEFGMEYETLRSFFVYKDYSHIFKFYESDKFHRCEKKYNKLLKLDISKCFDSIYTHSLAWALLGRRSVKASRASIKKSKETFGGRFDSFMQLTNYNETNGIIIGPEFSRFFAELILQSVDRAVCLELSCHAPAHCHQEDYEVFRYVDDYFVFYNEEKTKDAVLKILQLKLKEYKLYLNMNKAIHYDKPIITNISMAKQRIAELLDEHCAYKIEKVISEKGNPTTREEEQSQTSGRIHVNSNALITQFKTIIKVCAVDYKDTLNYTLAIVHRKSKKIVEDFALIKDASEKQLVEAILGICEFTFFIYSVAPRVNTTIRLCKILEVFISFLKERAGNTDLKHTVFKLMFDNVCFILEKCKSAEHTPVETLYLLIVLSELGRDYWLDENALCMYFNIRSKAGPAPQAESRLNYISLVVLLFYMKDKKRFEYLRTAVERMVKEKFENRGATLRKDTELTLLLFDTLACPYVKPEIKKEILAIYGFVGKTRQEAIIRKREYWFTKWVDFDFRKELDAKQSLEVY